MKTTFSVYLAGAMFAQLSTVAFGQTVIPADKTITLTIVADTTFTARKAVIPFVEAGTVDGSGQYTSSSIQNEAASYMVASGLKNLGATIVQTEWPALATDFAPFATTMAPFFLYAGIALDAVPLYNYYVTADHTYIRVYSFFAPVDGNYDVSFWVPGDWDKPASDVYVTSYAASGNYQQTLLSQTMVSDQTLTRNIFLRQGLNSVKVDLGSGSVLFHNAGYLVSVNLNNPTYLTWTYQQYPVTAVQASLSSLVASSIGGTKDNYISYNPQVPFTITDGNVPIFQNQSVVSHMPDKPPVYSYNINRFSDVDVEKFYCMPDATFSGMFINGMGKFTTTRLADYNYEHDTLGGL